MCKTHEPPDVLKYTYNAISIGFYKEAEIRDIKR